MLTDEELEAAPRVPMPIHEMRTRRARQALACCSLLALALVVFVGAPVVMLAIEWWGL